MATDELNMETYLRWKEKCASKGTTPMNMVQLFRSMGMDDYADKLESFIKEMEASLAEPSQ